MGFPGILKWMGFVSMMESCIQMDDWGLPHLGTPHAYDKYTDIYADKKMIDWFIYSFSYLHVYILRDIPIDFLTYILTCTLTY